MRMLITGGSGKLGTELKKQFPNAVFPTRKDLDISDLKSIDNFFKGNAPDIIIHAGAMTDIKKCETDRDAAWLTNVIGTENLFKKSLQKNPNVYFVYISTVGVFSCDKGNYNEDSIPYPQNFYCFTKYIAEERIKNYTNVCIMRTNFVSRNPWPHEKAFTDRFGTYLFDTGVVKGIKDILKLKPSGIIHICGDRKISMFELAKLTRSDIQPITLKEYSGPKLTINMTLITKKWKTYSLND